MKNLKFIRHFFCFIVFQEWVIQLGERCKYFIYERFFSFASFFPCQNILNSKLFNILFSRDDITFNFSKLIRSFIFLSSSLIGPSKQLNTLYKTRHIHWRWLCPFMHTICSVTKLDTWNTIFHLILSLFSCFFFFSYNMSEKKRYYDMSTRERRYFLSTQEMREPARNEIGDIFASVNWR